MRACMLFLLPILLLHPACAASQMFVNDSEQPADGVHIEFSQPVTITTPDTVFPHHHPPDASRSLWFFGWKLPPDGEITIDWRPSHAEVVGVYWLPWEAAHPLEKPGRVDAFEDGDLFCDLGSEWIVQSCGSDADVNPLRVRGTPEDAYLEVMTQGDGTVSVTIDFPPRDVSQYEGLYLRMSASNPCSVSIELMARDPACNSDYRFVNSAEAAELTGAAAEYRCPLSSFETEPGTCPADEAGLLAGRLIHIALFVSASEAGAFRIHEVGFYLPDNL